MFEKVVFFGLGFLLARYLVLNTPDYAGKEAEKIDQIREAAHNLIKKYAPQADDVQVGEDVIKNIN